MNLKDVQAGIMLISKSDRRHGLKDTEERKKSSFHCSNFVISVPCQSPYNTGGCESNLVMDDAPGVTQLYCISSLLF